MGIEGNENKFLKEINHYQTLLAKEHQKLLSIEDNYDILEHINLLREQEIKMLDEVSFEDAFILFEMLLENINISCSECDIINDKRATFVPHRRMLQELLRILSDDSQLINSLEFASSNAIMYLQQNYYSTLQQEPTTRDYIPLNRKFCEDSTYLFLGLLDGIKISPKERNRVKYGFLYLYPEIMDEISFMRLSLTRENSQMLAKTYEMETATRHNLYTSAKDFYWMPSYYATKNLAAIKDSALTSKAEIDKLVVSKLYLQSMMEMLPKEQLQSVTDIYLEQCEDEGKKIFDTSNIISYYTFKQIINEVKQQKTYQK